MTVRSTDREILSLVDGLHERSLINGNALVSVLQELTAGMPLTRDHLTQIFGREALVQLLGTPAPASTFGDAPMRQAQLDELRGELLSADDHDGLVRVFLQLLTFLEQRP